MKRVCISLLAAILCISHGFCENESMDRVQSSHIALSPQDVPVFYDNNPLTGLKAFTVITSFSLKEMDIQKKVGQLLQKILSEIGEVIHLKDTDMRGFGSGSVLLIQMGNVVGWDESEMPIARLSLSIETSVLLDKTGIKTFPMIWSINAFLQKTPNFESNLSKALQKLVNDFAQNYRSVNPAQKTRPVFYIYD